METILQRCQTEPIPFMYMGIGSCPHISKDKKLQPRYDQLIPPCFQEILFRDKTPMRIVHFDPAFEYNKEIIEDYMNDHNLVSVECDGGRSWVGESLEILVFPLSICHNEHYWFFEALSDIVLQKKGKLVIQEYTGISLTGLRYKLFESTPQKEDFKRRILLDMTYGTDEHCCTDMTKAQPFYDYNGCFLNFHHMSDADAKRWAGISLKIDELLKKRYSYKYLDALNTLHCEYRKEKQQGHDETAEDIMKRIQAILLLSFEILRLVNVVGKQQESVFLDLLQTYKQHDPYKWCDAMKKLLPGP